MFHMQTTHPDGSVKTDTRPGHSISGILQFLCPFLRAHPVRLSRVQITIERSTLTTTE